MNFFFNSLKRIDTVRVSLSTYGSSSIRPQLLLFLHSWVTSSRQESFLLNPGSKRVVREEGRKPEVVTR